MESESPPLQVDHPQPWDDFVVANGGSIVQSEGWARAKRMLGQAVVPSRSMAPTGEILAGAQIVVRTLAPRVAVGYVAGGPLIVPAGRPPSPTATTAVDRLVSDARGAAVRLLVVQPPEGIELDGVLASRGFVPSPLSVGPEATVRLDLTLDDDSLLAGMSTMRRRNIRRTLRSGISVVESSDIEGFWRLHLLSAQRQGFVPRSREYLDGQWSALRPSGSVAILEARLGECAVAAVWVTNFAGTVTFRLPGWDHTIDAPKGVNELLHWEVMRWARSRGATTYDLGGFDRGAAEHILAGNPVDDALRAGHHFFKLGFNPIPTLLPRAWVRFTDRWVPGPVQTALVGVMGHPRADRLAARWRNG